MCPSDKPLLGGLLPLADPFAPTVQRSGAVQGGGLPKLRLDYVQEPLEPDGAAQLVAVEALRQDPEEASCNSRRDRAAVVLKKPQAVRDAPESFSAVQIRRIREPYR